MKIAFDGKMFFCAMAVLASVTSADIRIPELRQWTSTSGSNLTARFVEKNGNSVVLERNDGRRVKIGAGRLSLKDRLWMNEWIKSGDSEPALETEDSQELDGEVPAGNIKIEVPSHSDELSVFAEGKWEGLYSAYERPGFDAVIDGQAVMSLYMKKDGKRVEQEPFIVQMSCKYSGPSSRSGGYRKITEFSSPGTPVIQPRDIDFKGKLEGGIDFSLFYKFRQNTIEMWGYAIDPKDIKKPTKFRIQFKIAKAFDIPLQMPMDEQEELMKGNRFTMRSTDGKRITCEYIKREKLKRYAKEVAITGPIYGGRHITLVAGDYKKAPLSPYVSTIGAPWEGWSVTMTKENAFSERSQQKMVITIK